MSDELYGLDGLELFNIDILWESFPSQDRTIYVNDNIYPGTIHSIRFFTEADRKFKISIADGETKLYSLLTFFADMQGRLKKFWFADPFGAFTVTEITDNPAPTIKVTKLANLVLRGGELLFIQCKNGDRKTLIISSVSQGATTDFVVNALPAITVADIEKCSLVYLVRFDQDAIDISFDTDLHASCELNFIELVHEY